MVSGEDGLEGRLYQMCIKSSKMGEDWLRTDYTHI